MSDPKRRREQRASKEGNLKALYAASRKKFTAADLQKFTEIEEGIPAEKVLTELERMYGNHTRKKRA